MDKSINIRIGQEIRAYLESQGLVQSMVAEKLQMTQGAVSAYYRGKPIGKNSAKKWAEVFGFRENWLLTGEGSMLQGETSQPSLVAEHIPQLSDVEILLRDMLAEKEAKIDTLNDLILELKDQIAELLQENAVLKYENMMLTPRKGDAENVADSSAAIA